MLPQFSKESAVDENDPIRFPSGAIMYFTGLRRGKSVTARLLAAEFARIQQENDRAIVQIGQERSPQAEGQNKEDLLQNRGIVVWVDESHLMKPPTEVPDIPKKAVEEKPKPERPWVEMKRRSTWQTRKKHKSSGRQKRR